MAAPPEYPLTNYQMIIQAIVDDTGNIIALDLPSDPRHVPIFVKMLRAACEHMGIEVHHKIKFREFL